MTAAGVFICRVPMEEIRRTDDGERWCFVCRLVANECLSYDDYEWDDL